MECVGILNGTVGNNVSSDFRDRGGGGGTVHQHDALGVGLGLLEDFGSLAVSPNADAAAEAFGSDLFCWLVEGVLILVIKVMKYRGTHLLTNKG